MSLKEIVHVAFGSVAGLGFIYLLSLIAYALQ